MPVCPKPYFRPGPFLWVLLFLSTGIGLTEYFRSPVVALGALTTGFFLYILSLFFRPAVGKRTVAALRFAPIGLLLVAAGAFSTQLTRERLTATSRYKLSSSDTFRVIGNPEPREGKLRMQVQLTGGSSPSYILYIRHEGEYEPVARGDMLKLRNFYARSAEEWEQKAPAMGRYMAGKGLSGSLHAKTGDVEILLTAKGPFSLRQKALDLSDRLAATLYELSPSLLSDSQCAMLEAMCLGREGEAPDVRRKFVAAGVAHILAVSGFHVGIVLAALGFLMRILPIPQRWRRAEWLLPLAGGWIYAFVCGLGAPVVRAMLMATLYIVGKCSGRPTDGLNIWAAAACITLVIDPLSFYDVGFVLSYAAVASILIFFRPLASLLPDVRQPLLRLCRDAMALCLAAQAFTLPLAAHYFGHVGIIFLWVNLPLTLLVVFLIPLSLIYMVLAAVGLPLMLLSRVVGICADGVERLVTAAAAVSPSMEYAWQPSMPVVLCIMAVLLAVGILWRANRRRYE